MRNPLMAMTVVLILTTGHAWPAPPKAPTGDGGAGTVAWFDLATSNMAGSREFYGKLFDWKFVPIPGTDQAVVIMTAGTEIGTLRTSEGKLSPFNGVVYIQVTDILASCRKAKELGGTVVPGFPFNVPGGRGAIALLTDPVGHPVGMFSRTVLPSGAVPAR